MRAVDTNVLVVAANRDSPHHAQAHRLITDLAEDSVPWALPWPCVYEFLRVVTHPRVFHPPMSMKAALADLSGLLGSPSVVMLQETERHPEIMATLLESSAVTGNLVYDARIAALCIEHGVDELVTGDRDFSRFPDLRLVDPFPR